ncbi:hypothetical protein CSQ79_15520 [Gloeocapsopsis sp. IPPAS B-1203]|nr:hypothetical protein CSQ79_15520 [Gloeocapsopsis sp. IPPAS B-1203]
MTFWQTAARKFNKLSPLECAQCDERFHEQIAMLSQNAELLHSLEAINARAYYLRLISMEKAHYRHNCKLYVCPY